MLMKSHRQVAKGWSAAARRLGKERSYQECDRVGPGGCKGKLSSKRRTGEEEKGAFSGNAYFVCVLSFSFLLSFLGGRGGEGGGSACQFASGGEEVVEDAGQCADGRKLSRSDLETGVCLEPGGEGEGIPR